MSFTSASPQKNNIRLMAQFKLKNLTYW